MTAAYPSFTPGSCNAPLSENPEVLVPMPLMKSLTRFAQSRQGRRLAQQAMRYAQSPEGKRMIAQTRERLAKTRRTRPR